MVNRLRETVVLLAARNTVLEQQIQTLLSSPSSSSSSKGAGCASCETLNRRVFEAEMEAEGTREAMQKVEQQLETMTNRYREVCGAASRLGLGLGPELERLREEREGAVERAAKMEDELVRLRKVLEKERQAAAADTAEVEQAHATSLALLAAEREARRDDALMFQTERDRLGDQIADLRSMFSSLRSEHQAAASHVVQLETAHTQTLALLEAERVARGEDAAAHEADKVRLAQQIADLRSMFVALRAQTSSLPDG